MQLDRLAQDLLAVIQKLNNGLLIGPQGLTLLQCQKNHHGIIFSTGGRVVR